MSHDPFVSPQAYQEAFLNGLLKLLDEPTLATFILAYANASLEPALLTAGEARLGEVYATLANDCRSTLTRGDAPQAADDDVLVFLKLMALGLERLQPAATRQVGPWEVHFNHLRAFRPRRAGGKPFTALREPFDPHGFHFNKPFLARETFWNGTLHGRSVSLLYNKFPIVEGHGLLVPEQASHRPQYIEEHDHHWIWGTVRELGRQLPGMGIAYNSLGAFASINHLHFHLYLRERPLPIEAPEWKHNGGPTPYPALCKCFEDPDAAWEYVHRLHEAQVPYHLIYLPGRACCLPRRPQGSYEQAPWTAGYAWYEMAGGLTLFEKERFLHIDAAALEAELAQVTLRPMQESH